MEYEADYEPLDKYVETSDLIKKYFTSDKQKIFLIIKLVTVVVALILYGYFKHEDNTFASIIKTALIVIFSEFYLIYQFFNIVILKNGKRKLYDFN